jgi:signal transduction histidine kinase
LLLISGAFWYAERNAENLVNDGPRQTGRSVVDSTLMHYHFERAFPRGPSEQEAPHHQMAQEIYEELGTQNYQWKILVLGFEGVERDALRAKGRKIQLPENEQERSIVEELEAQLAERLATTAQPQQLGDTQAIPDAQADGPVESEAGTAMPEAAPKETSDEGDEPVAKLVQTPTEYHYYQAVPWKNNSCFAVCHTPIRTAFASSGGDPVSLASPGTLRVMKVIIPSKPTRDKIVQTRAILLAIAIATVFLSMIALYVVVRYVIVKPLSHLREVSDEISRGNYDLRANIQTNDEFEDLAASFNRMLRHLVDAQRELRTVNADLDSKVDELAQANMQLHEVNRVKSDFLANMSHELRTPLNSIIGFADVLKDNNSLSDKQRRYADNIGTSGRALLDMINDILDLAKMESGKMDVRLAEFFIEPVVTAQCDLLRTMSEEKNIDLKVAVQANLPPLYQDQGKVQQILVNLLSNAIKFTPEGGRIMVTAERDHLRRLVLTVEDTGVGIAEEDREVIFEKFRQSVTAGADHLTREYSGTGLGLSIVKELCKLLGGEISFESELGKGSTFTVQVPWTLPDRPKLDSSLKRRLDDVTKPRRLDFAPAVEPPIPAPADPAATE